MQGLRIKHCSAFGDSVPEYIVAIGMDPLSVHWSSL
jgi:hypothetical protein